MPVRDDIESFLTHVTALYFVPPSIENNARTMPIIFFVLNDDAWDKIFEWNVYKEMEKYFLESQIHLHFSSREAGVTLTLTNKENGDSINIRNFKFDGPMLEFFDTITENEKILLLLCFRRNNKIEFHPASYESKGIAAHSLSVEKKNYES